MAKTAEEKFKEIGVYPDDYISSSAYFGAVKAAEDFAAQEVEAYKERLKAELYTQLPHAPGLRNDIELIIDVVK